MMNTQLDILAFGAHPDDVELSCAGTIAKSIAQGKTVGIVDLTQGELGTRGNIETRYKEAALASSILGVNHRVNLQLKDGFFVQDEQSIRLIIEQIRRFKPTIVLANSIVDRHPDHAKAAKLVSEACYLSGLPKIETSWNGAKQEAHRPKSVFHYVQEQYITPDFVVDVSDYIDQKVRAIKAYSTQFFDENSDEPKTPISGEKYIEFVLGKMLQYGRPIGVDYAEGYTSNRIIGVESLFDLA